MRKPLYLGVTFLFLSMLCAQRSYNSVDEIKSEWGDYTSYQRDELISFCDFLFKEKHYERCLLSSFQFLFKFPEDPVRPAILYIIARSYEELKNYSLSRRYYNQLIKLENKNSVAYKAATRRGVYADLLSGDYQVVFEKTAQTDDPYLLTFRGYAFMKKLNWAEARLTFMLAQSNFGHPHYDELIAPLFLTIENVQNVPMHNKYLVAVTGLLFPGGGQFILNDINKGQGVLASAGLLALAANWSKIKTVSGSKRFLKHQSLSMPAYKNLKQESSGYYLKDKNNLPKPVSFTSSSLKYSFAPIFLAIGVYTGGFLKSFYDTQNENKKLLEYYVADKIVTLSPDSFLDFPEPQLIIDN